MTPAQLTSLIETHVAVHDPKSSGGRKQRVSKNPAADLAQLAAL